jgi:hypothetical protein
MVKGPPLDMPSAHSSVIHFNTKHSFAKSLITRYQTHKYSHCYRSPSLPPRLYWHVFMKPNIFYPNHLGGGPVVKVWDQEVCSLCGLRFEPCGCSYDDHWRLTWSLTSGPVGLVEVRAS